MQSKAELREENARFRDFVTELLNSSFHMRRGCQNQVPRWPGKKMPICSDDCLQARRLLGLPDAPEWTAPER